MLRLSAFLALLVCLLFVCWLFVCLREVECFADSLARFRTLHEICEPRVIHFQSVTNNRSAFSID